MDAGVQRGLGVLYVVGRLAPGRTLDEARAEMDVIVPALWETHFSRWDTRSVVITPLADYLFGSAETALFVLLGRRDAPVADCQRQRNRADDRSIAVAPEGRGGAVCARDQRQGRLFRAHLVETLLITAAAAAGGIALASAALPLLVALGPADMPQTGALRGERRCSIGLQPWCWPSRSDSR